MDARSGVVVGFEVRGGGQIRGWTRDPVWRSDMKSGVAVGHEIRGGGQTQGQGWRSEQGPD